jgi:hypothetical protein
MKNFNSIILKEPPIIVFNDFFYQAFKLVFVCVLSWNPMNLEAFHSIKGIFYIQKILVEFFSISLKH